MTDCQKAQDFMRQLKGVQTNLLSEYDNLIARNKVDSDTHEYLDALRTAAGIAVREIEQIVGIEIERLLNLEEQYNHSIELLKRVGLIRKTLDCNLDTSENNGAKLGEFWGTIGVGGRFYYIPDYQAIVRQLRRDKKHQELLKEKFHQGFTKLLIVPFAFPINQFIHLTIEDLRKFDQEGKLKDSSGNIIELDNPNEVSPDLIEADLGKIVPTNLPHLVYLDNRFGLGLESKKAILSGNKFAPGYRILLVEDLVDLPRKGAEKTLPENAEQSPTQRKQLAPGLNADEYLKLLAGDPQYRGEIGLTVEDWFTLLLTTIEDRNQVIDDSSFDLGGAGKASWLLGSYISKTHRFPRASWNRFLGGFQLGLFGARESWSDRSVRTAVRLI